MAQGLPVQRPFAFLHPLEECRRLRFDNNVMKTFGESTKEKGCFMAEIMSCRLSSVDDTPSHGLTVTGDRSFLYHRVNRPHSTLPVYIDHTRFNSTRRFLSTGARGYAPVAVEIELCTCQ